MIYSLASSAVARPGRRVGQGLEGGGSRHGDPVLARDFPGGEGYHGAEPMVLGKRRLRVVLFARADAASNPGGDVVEAAALCAGLVAAGHEAELVLDGRGCVGRWDVVHLLNIDRAAELAAFLDGHGGFPGARVVLAPVFNGTTDVASGLGAELRTIANLVRGSLRPSRAWIPGRAAAGLAARVDGLHFHTEVERRAFGEAVPGFECPSVVVPPPIWWPDSVRPTGAPPREPGFAAVIGRIEPLKNQLWLLESGITRVIPVVFLGAGNPKRPWYLARFERALARDPAASWRGRVDRGEVRETLAAARLHILASRRENYGLATVEALSLGCEALVPHHHQITAELGDALHVFDLAQPATLHAAVQAVRAGSRRAPAFNGERHTVGAVTAAILGLYDEVLARHAGR